MALVLTHVVASAPLVCDQLQKPAGKKNTHAVPDLRLACFGKFAKSASLGLSEYTIDMVCKHKVYHLRGLSRVLMPRVVDWFAKAAHALQPCTLSVEKSHMQPCDFKATNRFPQY